MNNEIASSDESDPFPPLDAEFLEDIDFPELFFGIVAPIGIDTKEISTFLNESLKAVGYQTSLIKITKLMKQIPTDVDLVEMPEQMRYETYIKYANAVRRRLSEPDDPKSGNDSLAMLVIGAIQTTRAQYSGSRKKAARRTAYVLDQFKRPEEILLLRRVYGRLFVQISVHATKETRKSNLKRKFRASHPESGGRDYSAEAEDLIRTDLDQESEQYGQRVRDAFPLADVIIDGNNKEQARAEINRFIKLLFGFNFISPTHDEYGMYSAKAASLRSADLSRQVGAAIFSINGDILTMGANEVPKAGGGTYFEGDKPDHRDFAHGGDFNEQEKRSIVREIVKKLDDKDCLTIPAFRGKNEVSLEDKVQYVLKSPAGPNLQSARVMDILEFGRQIHAEMNALCDAARTGRSVQDATLYCTTFPCHMCAKLILGSGIGRVVYIEPYPKSYAEEMYSHSIALEAHDSS